MSQLNFTASGLGLELRDTVTVSRANEEISIWNLKEVEAQLTQRLRS